MSAIKDDGKPSPVDLTSVVGTWLAAGLAIVALLGVVAPLLAIQSSMSDKNRPLNAVQDLPQKYISQGYHLWTGYRAFRNPSVYILGLTILSGQEDRFTALRWNTSPWHRHEKFTDYLASDVLLSSSLDEPEVKSIRLALGTLFIMDKGFRAWKTFICVPSVKVDVRQNGRLQQLKTTSENKEPTPLMLGSWGFTWGKEQLRY
ncbi:hypothetical protein V2G26_009892 [Clonostachys chloroleuca]